MCELEGEAMLNECRYCHATIYLIWRKLCFLILWTFFCNSGKLVAIITLVHLFTIFQTLFKSMVSKRHYCIHDNSFTSTGFSVFLRKMLYCKRKQSFPKCKVIQRLHEDDSFLSHEMQLLLLKVELTTASLTSLVSKWTCAACLKASMLLSVAFSSSNIITFYKIVLIIPCQVLSRKPSAETLCAKIHWGKGSIPLKKKRNFMKKFHKTRSLLVTGTSPDLWNRN